MSLTKPERSHFFSWLYGKSKEDFRKSLPVPDSGERIGVYESPVGAVIRPSRSYFRAALRSRRGDRSTNAYRCYGRGSGVIRGLGSGVILGEGVGLGVGVGVCIGVAVGVTVAAGVAVAVGVNVGVTVAVGVEIGVAVPVAVGVAVAVAVGVGVGVPLILGTRIGIVIGAPVLKKPTVAVPVSGRLFESNRKLYKVPQRMALAF